MMTRWKWGWLAGLLLIAGLPALPVRLVPFHYTIRLGQFDAVRERA
jgi:hypothetical protein